MSEQAGERINIQVRLTSAEKAEIQRRATEAGFPTVSRYIIHRATGGTQKQGEVSILATLSRQIGAVQAEARRTGWTEELMDELADVAKAVREALGFRKS